MRGSMLSSWGDKATKDPIPALRLAQSRPRIAQRKENYSYPGPWGQEGAEMTEKEALGSVRYRRLPGGGSLEQNDTLRISRIAGGAEGEAGKSQPQVRVQPPPGPWMVPTV